jgi:hypothetical protein
MCISSANCKNHSKDYKLKIYKLCSAAKNGNKLAEAKLKEELEKSSQARWALEHWLKTHRRRLRQKSKNTLSSDDKIKGKKKPNYGNAFKPYSGGAFELGKK